MSQWSADGAGSDADLLGENPFFNRGAIQDPEYFYDRRREARRALRMHGCPLSATRYSHPPWH